MQHSLVVAHIILKQKGSPSECGDPQIRSLQGKDQGSALPLIAVRSVQEARMKARSFRRAASLCLAVHGGLDFKLPFRAGIRRVIAIALPIQCMHAARKAPEV